MSAKLTPHAPGLPEQGGALGCPLGANFVMGHTGSGVVDRFSYLLGEPALVSGSLVRVLHAICGINALAAGLEHYWVKVACVYLIPGNANVLEIGISSPHGVTLMLANIPS